MHIRIGTRGSQLALWQAEDVAKRLQNEGCTTEIITISTKGDEMLDVSISKIGSKGVFTEEIEAQLANGSIDIAVHSAKDLQSTLPDEFDVLAFLPREKVNDVLIVPATLGVLGLKRNLLADYFRECPELVELIRDKKNNDRYRGRYFLQLLESGKP